MLLKQIIKDTPAVSPASFFYVYDFETPLGMLHAIADDQTLHFLQFKDEIKNYSAFITFLHSNQSFITEKNKILLVVEDQLERYFKGTLTSFAVPLITVGTVFQNEVWKSLTLIEYGSTITYQQQAVSLKRPRSFRAVANANGANKIALIIPCHRVIQTSGLLGGYAGGAARKQWLLNHERTVNFL